MAVTADDSDDEKPGHQWQINTRTDSIIYMYLIQIKILATKEIGTTKTGKTEEIEVESGHVLNFFEFAKIVAFWT